MTRKKSFPELVKVKSKQFAAPLLALLVAVGAVLCSSDVTPVAMALDEDVTTGYTLCVPAGGEVTPVEMTVDAQIVLARLQLGFGLTDAQVSLSGDRCINAQVPTVAKQKSFLMAAIKPGFLALTNSGGEALPAGTSVRLRCKQKGCAPGIKVGKTNLRSKPVVLQIVVPPTQVLQGSATVAPDSSGAPMIDYSFDSDGSTAWCRYTTRHVRGFVAIVVDRKVVSDPQILSPVCGGVTQVVGLSSQFQAKTIAAYLNFGALPLRLALVTTN